MLNKKLFSLQYKFTIISLFIAIIPLLLVGGLSYVKSSEMIEKKVSQSNFNTVQQIADNINLIFADMASSSMYLWRDEIFMSYMKLAPSQILSSPRYVLAAQNSVNNFVVFKTDIYSIYVQGYNGLVFDSASSHNHIPQSLQQRLSKLRGEGVLMADVVTNYDHSTTKVISFLRVLKDMDDLSSDLAIIKINISEEDISKIYKSKLLSHSSDFFIMDEEKNIVSALDKTKLGTRLEKKYDDSRLNSNSKGYFNADIDGRKFIVTYYNLSRTGWKLVNLVPLHELSEDTKVIQNITLYAVTVSFALCLLVIVLFSLKVLSPLKQIRKSMKHLENENFNVTIDVRGNDEIALLGQSFNKMSKRLGELINEVYAVQIKQKEAELKALQSQINPHFLYNTLDTIYWMCRIEKANESSNLVQALSKLFRLSLNSGNEFTTVKNEVEHLNFYITIQEKRFKDMIGFNIKVSEEALKCKVVKLILQPLVENAIHHGIEKKGTKGRVEINIYRKEDTLFYVVSDDGAGADEAELNSLLAKVEEGNRGFGIKNVNDRIKIYFGNDYGIQFRTSPGEGTTVIVTQPFINGG